ncbi:pyruvate kinase [Acidiplasma cupricumulans]|jgi:pyruvate kinase|uniref:Pyruvate kinase n=1 Tax=Acidiplasma cupricumulans TaxID=312540 RepID=A0A0Q0XI64_9ARCH|nr:pyruvate kinase [Acidiplasma cupricumulans]KQB34385.1 pyruvate kinase [Acidiplasma cupricumulans]
MPKTKIVATIGPASFNENILKNMARKGLSVIRINTAHIEPGYILSVSKLLNKINSDLNTKIGIMVDLKGPELRTGLFKSGYINIEAGKNYVISSANTNADITLNHDITKYIDEETVIAINDGKIHFKVLSVKDNDITTTALDSGIIHDTSRVNIPGRYIDLGTITERDKIFIGEGIKSGATFYALSFVQQKENVYDLQDYIYESGSSASIVSKIETKKGYDNIESIVNASDFIMVARGDLGVELPLKEVAMAQKKIIMESHRKAVPTIVATQMLESMVNADSPTRAEVSDVTNAILDDTDALMLSEETAIGKYPVEAVSYLSDISEFVESHKLSFSEPETIFTDRLAFSISLGLRRIVEGVDINSIIALTKSGHTARIISSIRPEQDIYAVVTSENLAKALNLLRGVIPVVVPKNYVNSNNIYDIINELSSKNILRAGQKTIVISGSPSLIFGGTNDIKVLNIGAFLGRGYAVGKSIKGKINTGNGSGNILIADSYDKNAEYTKFDAVIFRSCVSERIKDYFINNNITLVYNTEFSSNIIPDMEINVDSDTGIITYI